MSSEEAQPQNVATQIRELAQELGSAPVNLHNRSVTGSSELTVETFHSVFFFPPFLGCGNQPLSRSVIKLADDHFRLLRSS